MAFNQSGDRLLTGSFDHTVSIWRTRDCRLMHKLVGHRGEISSCMFNHEGTQVITGSMDKTCKVWCATSGELLQTLMYV